MLHQETLIYTVKYPTLTALSLSFWVISPQPPSWLILYQNIYLKDPNTPLPDRLSICVSFLYSAAVDVYEHIMMPSDQMGNYGYMN